MPECAEDLFAAWLTPQEHWPPAAQEDGLQHNVSTWAAVQPLVQAALTAVEPDTLLYLPPLTSALDAAAVHSWQCVRVALTRAAAAESAESRRGGSGTHNSASAHQAGGANAPDVQGVATAPEDDSTGTYAAALKAAAAESAVTGFGTHIQMCTWFLNRIPGMYAAPVRRRRSVHVVERIASVVDGLLQKYVRSE